MALPNPKTHVWVSGAPDLPSLIFTYINVYTNFLNAIFTSSINSSLTPLEDPIRMIHVLLMRSCSIFYRDFFFRIFKSVSQKEGVYHLKILKIKNYILRIMHWSKKNRKNNCYNPQFYLISYFFKYFFKYIGILITYEKITRTGQKNLFLSIPPLIRVNG